MKQKFITNNGNNSPLLIHAPHGGTYLPKIARKSLIIDKKELASEILAMTDHHTSLLAHQASQNLRKSLSGQPASFINQFSRLTFDPERFPDDREEMNAVGMGAVYTHGSQHQRIRKDGEAVKHSILEKFFNPYAQEFTDLTDRLLDSYGKATIVDVHSYATIALPYELHTNDKRPEICIGSDSYHSPDELIEAAVSIFQDSGYEVHLNEPFSGTYVPLKHYGVNKNVSSLMVEIRRDTYMDEQTGGIIENKYQVLLKTFTEFLKNQNKFQASQ